MISQDGISYPHLISSTTSINEFDNNNNNNNYLNPNPNPNPNPDNTSSSNKRKRSLPGNPDPDAEVVALSPRSLMATNRFICEVCNKGFQREQNLQLHRRGHNLPWKLKQKSKEPVRKKVYLCPEKTCVHHDPSRALGDLTGIKKHFSRKHGEKKWKCDKCSKKYAVMSDWKAHSKICGTREYKCDCGTIFSRKDSFITHRAFCDALTEERMRVNGNLTAAAMNPNFRVDMINGSFMSMPQSVTGISSFSTSHRPDFLSFESSPSGAIVDSLNKPRLPLWLDHQNPQSMNSHHLELQSNGASQFLASSGIGRGGAGHVLPEFPTSSLNLFSPPGILKNEEETGKSNYPQSLVSLYSSEPPPPPQTTSPAAACSMSATALLQKAAQIGSTRSDNNSTVFANTSNNNHMFRQGANRHQLVGVERHQGYSAADQLMMMGASLGDNGGMRDFLGTLGGAAGRSGNVGVSNVDETDGGRLGGGDQRRVVLQEEMAYKMATMAAGGHHMDLIR